MDYLMIINHINIGNNQKEIKHRNSQSEKNDDEHKAIDKNII